MNNLKRVYMYSYVYLFSENCLRRDYHKKWNRKNIKNAIDAVKRKNMGFLKVPMCFNVPKSSLELNVKRDKPKKKTMLARNGSITQLYHLK